MLPDPRDGAAVTNVTSEPRAASMRQAILRTPTLIHDQPADAVIVAFADEPVEFSRQLDSDRRIDFDQEGRVIAIALERVSWGVELSEIPFRRLVYRLLAEHCIKTIA
jgi:uncharacterized protein YuzE